MSSALARLPNLLRRRALALFQRPPDPQSQLVMETLAACPLFARFPSRALHHVAEGVHVRHYARGEVIFHVGDPAFGLYVVQDGLVQLSAEDEDGRSEELQRHTRGAVLGETALIGDFRRAETATSLRDTAVLGLFRPDLHTLLKKAPRTGLMVMVAVAQRMAAREEALLHVLREGHLPAHRLLRRLHLDEPADPLAFIG